MAATATTPLPLGAFGRGLTDIDQHDCVALAVAGLGVVLMRRGQMRGTLRGSGVDIETQRHCPP